MNIVVYDGWLETLGGGERQTLAACAALREFGRVILLAHRSVELGKLEERAGFDLAGVEVVIRPETARPLELLKGLEVEMFVNATHHSGVPAPHDRSIRFEYFPPARFPWWKSVLAESFGRIGGRLQVTSEGSGWYGPESLGRGWYRQSDGRGEIHVNPGSGVRLWLADMVGGPQSRCPFLIRGYGSRVLAEGDVVGGGNFTATPWITIPPECDRVVVESQPRLVGQTADRRSLGLALGSIEERGSVVQRLWHLVSRRIMPSPSRWAAERELGDFARAYRSYQVVSPNSHYTADWLHRWWGIAGEVIEPPVVLSTDASAARQPLILSIGRFFAGGHNKKHMKMISTFAKLLESGLSGWRLVFVGGVGQRSEDQAYLGAVEDAARGLPIEVRANASEDLVRRLRGCAAIGWHAAGQGESTRRHPERYEHFGMAVAEMMAAGVVPVAIDGGGVREIVAHGKTGYRWRNQKQLAGFTLRLARDARLRSDMSYAARMYAQRWSLARYQRRVRALVERVYSEGRGVTLESYR